jgi:hypothetical protein
MSLSASISGWVVLIFDIGVILTLIGLFILFSNFIQGNGGDRLKPSILTSACIVIGVLLIILSAPSLV